MHFKTFQKFLHGQQKQSEKEQKEERQAMLTHILINFKKFIVVTKLLTKKNSIALEYNYTSN